MDYLKQALQKMDDEGGVFKAAATTAVASINKFCKPPVVLNPPPP